MRISDWSSDVCSSDLIWTSEADALASIANYFVDAGWRKDVPWGVPVAVPSNLDRNAIMNRTNAARCPRVFERHSMWKTMAEWRQLGLVPQGEGWPADPVLAKIGGAWCRERGCK